MKFIARTLVAAALLFVATSAGAAEPNVENGRIHFNRGVALYREADFPAAAIEFRRAYETAPSYRILFNLAQALTELKDYAGALDAFERYLAEGGTEVPAELAAVARAQIEKLDARVGRIEIRTNVSGAQVTVDGTNVAITPLERPLRMSAGWHKISATFPGRVLSERSVEVGGGDALTVELDLAKPTPEPKMVARPEAKPTTARHVIPGWAPPASEPIGPQTRVIIGTAVTGTLVVATAISGVFALRAKSDYDAKANTFGTSSSELADQRNRTRNLAILTDVLGGLSVASGAATVYFAVSHGDSAKTHASARTPRLHLGPKSVALSGRF